jgi:hypothetical protein
MPVIFQRRSGPRARRPSLWEGSRPLQHTFRAVFLSREATTADRVPNERGVGHLVDLYPLSHHPQWGRIDMRVRNFRPRPRVPWAGSVASWVELT